MVTLAQRIETLRTQKGLSRPELAKALGLPRTAVEKFETGRLTPSKEQMDKLAAFFEVSLFYLRGESNDPTRQDSWMDSAWSDQPDPQPVVSAPSRPAKQASGGQGDGFHAFWNTKAMQDSLRGAILEVLRSPEGEEILTRLIRKELDRRG